MLDWWLGELEDVAVGPPLGLFLFPALWVPSHGLCHSSLLSPEETVWGRPLR